MNLAAAERGGAGGGDQRFASGHSMTMECGRGQGEVQEHRGKGANLMNNCLDGINEGRRFNV